LNRRGLQKINPSSKKKILLIRLRRAGDVIMTTPAVTALRTSSPEAYISYIVEEPYRELVEGNTNLDRVFVLPRNLSTRAFIRFMRQIRREKSDVVLDFHGGPTASLMTLFSRAKLKVGYKTKYKNFIYDKKLPRSFPTGPIHSVESHLNLVRALGVNISASPPLCVPQTQKAEEEKVKKFIQENKLEGKKSVILHISAGNEFRNWGVENLVEFTNLLSRLPEIKIILIGAEEDQKAEEEIIERSAASLLSLVGRLNLRELRELISRSSLFVGPDSGPMHVAASTSTPIVAYFGPTLPAHFAPWQADASIIEKDFDCRPCKQRQCIYDDFRCLRTIRPEEVYEACLQFIQNASYDKVTG
jgi:lipopolysaccharide heptosyltransferase II